VRRNIFLPDSARLANKNFQIIRSAE